MELKNYISDYLILDIQVSLINYLSIFDIKNLIKALPSLKFNYDLWLRLLSILNNKEGYLDLTLVEDMNLFNIEEDRLMLHELYIHELLCRRHIKETIENKNNRLLLFS